jgi:hypothetical protein
MKLLDEDLLAEGADDVEPPDELGEEDEDLLKDLEKMAEEVEDDANSID